MEKLLDEEKRRVKRIKLDIASSVLTPAEKSEEFERFETSLGKKHYKKAREPSTDTFAAILEGRDITPQEAAAAAVAGGGEGEGEGEGSSGGGDGEGELTNDEVEREIREALRNSQFLQIEKSAKKVLDAKCNEKYKSNQNRK